MQYSLSNSSLLKKLTFEQVVLHIPTSILYKVTTEVYTKRFAKTVRKYLSDSYSLDYATITVPVLISAEYAKGTQEQLDTYHHVKWVEADVYNRVPDVPINQNNS